MESLNYTNTFGDNAKYNQSGIDENSRTEEGKVLKSDSSKDNDILSIKGNQDFHVSIYNDVDYFDVIGNDSDCEDGGSFYSNGGVMSANDKSNFIFLGDAHNMAFGLGCNDVIHGNEGNDVLVGGHGSDKIYGGTGDDIIIVGHVEYDNSDYDPNIGHINIEFSGWAGYHNDRVHAGDGNDYVEGDFGNDLIFGDDGNDELDGNDVIYGGNGDDSIYSGSGVGTLFGGNGNDLIYLSDSPGSKAWGGEGNDNIANSGGTSNNPAEIILYGEGGDDILTVAFATAYGGKGDDYIYSWGSIVFGDEGDDLIEANHGANSGSESIMNGGKGNDTLRASDNSLGNTSVDIFVFSEGNDTYLNFVDNSNKIDLTYIGASFNDLSISGNVVEFDGHITTLQDFTGILTESDFIF